MGKRSFALERGGPRRLHLRWRFRLRDFQVAVDDRPPWTLDRPTVLRGEALVLPDGSSLFVRYVKRPWYSVGLRNELRVERDGIPLPGSDGDPRVLGRRVGGFLLLLVVVRILIAMALVPVPEVALWVLGEGIAVAVLGVLSWCGVRLAVLLAAGLFALEVLIALAANPGLGFVQALIAVQLLLAWRKMRPRVRQENLGEVFG